MPFPPLYAKQLEEETSELVVEMIKEFIEKGQLIQPISIPIILSPSTTVDQRFGTVSQAGQRTTSPETLNAGVTFLSVRTVGQSAAGFFSSAVLSKVCSITRVRIVVETISEACYQVAEEANRLALPRDKKIIPARKPIFNRNTGPAAFIIVSFNIVDVYRIIISNVFFLYNRLRLYKNYPDNLQKSLQYSLKKTTV